MYRTTIARAPVGYGGHGYCHTGQVTQGRNQDFGRGAHAKKTLLPRTIGRAATAHGRRPCGVRVGAGGGRLPYDIKTIYPLFKAAIKLVECQPLCIF